MLKTKLDILKNVGKRTVLGYHLYYFYYGTVGNNVSEQKIVKILLNIFLCVQRNK